MKGQGVRGRGAYIGFETGAGNNLYMKTPKLGFTNAAHRVEFSYVNLNKLGTFIEQGRVDPKEKITIRTLKKAGLVKQIHDGVKLLAKGASDFKWKVDIEVNAVSQKAIAAVEKAGGKVQSTYNNKVGLSAVLRPERWTEKNLPLPRQARPQPKRLDYYTDFKNRGYLSPEMNLVNKSIMTLDEVKEMVAGEKEKLRKVLEDANTAKIEAATAKKNEPVAIKATSKAAKKAQ